MKLDVSYVIAIIGCIVGVLGFVRSRDKDKTQESSTVAVIGVKLDNIYAIVTELKESNQNNTDKVDKHTELIIKLQEEVSSLKHRVNSLEGKE